MNRTSFSLNKRDGRILGVCAGLADHFDIDPTLVRVAAVLTLICTFPIGGVAYLLLAMLAGQGGAKRERYDRFEAYSRDAGDATRERMRALDARLQAIESYVTSPNQRLAREIDELR